MGGKGAKLFGTWIESRASNRDMILTTILLLLGVTVTHQRSVLQNNVSFFWVFVWGKCLEECVSGIRDCGKPRKVREENSSKSGKSFCKKANFCER